MQDGGYGGFSTGSYSSAGSFSSAGGYAGGYSTGGFTGGYGGSWTSCEEMYCYGTAYLDNGEVDWDATYAANVTCSTYDKGCPCNEKWELACESYGMKVCISKSEGCYDPFDVTCTDQEQLCKDEWSAYCWDKSWGGCPLYCGAEETYCYRYIYDATGEVNWTAPMTEFCGNVTTGCPCDATWEHKCTDAAYGYSWCNPKSSPCPITCGMDEQVCYTTPYDSEGYPDWTAQGTQSCQSQSSTCPCDPNFEELCDTEWGSYCQTKVYGSCPISCSEDQIYCYETPYDQSGNMDWNGVWKETCASITDGCPCNEQWEKSCGTGWCIPKWDSCPIDCGDNIMCYHYSGNQSCATSAGCTCEADEYSCQDSIGKYECYAKEWYPDGCPVVCTVDQLYCSTVGFDVSGYMTWSTFCKDRTSEDDWDCPVECDTTSAKKCGTGMNAYCISSSDECPAECTSQEQLCWVADYDAQGSYVTGSDRCAPADQECPCGANSVKCSMDGWSYCESTYYGCPVICGADEKSCYPVSFTPDWQTPVTESCVANTETCPCGANAKPCKWTDEYGYELEECFPDAWSCPVSCKAEQKKCYKTDYNATGYPTMYSETCVDQGTSCPCGTHSQKCHDPYMNEDLCYPTWDFWMNTRYTCPVYCKDNEDYCYVPSYDAQGDWISTKETCVPSGQKCDCSQGQNAFECTFSDPWYGSWSECLPKVGGYCPVTCPEGKVACDMVVDYLPNGTSLGYFQPPEQCADSFDKCPCGKEAERCNMVGCRPASEGCPITCTAEQKKCYLTDFSDAGSRISDREVCVASDATCPCGKNTAKCPGSDVCVLPSEKALICPCKESEEVCTVPNYDTYGKITDWETTCAKSGKACPCGKNTVSCPDPNDAENNLCSPKFYHKKCPVPCTVDQIQAGNATCFQTNLDSSGNFESETVTCLPPGEKCSPGKNMKRCPSGAVLPAASKCVNLYGTSNATAVDATQKETTTVYITLTGTSDKAAANSDTSRIKLNSALQLPADLVSTMSIATASSRRLSGRQLAEAKPILAFTVSNTGKSSVSPSAVGEQLKQMVTSSNPELTKAVNSVGSIDAKAGVNVDQSSKKVVTRTQTAKDKRAAQAGITTVAATTSK
ncbi:unnamed protein product, partial [Effrenium voratum]